ncbi:hypothetical protein [Thalassotalea atypica]|uniref:hypothetical protein n=1 Tax=Thalassotalea atypica TaxID=2054316 RepID=UPI0025731262|nr:hypothetical protein [Thalassotalea atypica]
MSYYYRREKYTRSRHSTKYAWLKWGLALTLLACCSAFSVHQLIKADKLSGVNKQKSAMIKQYEEELSILRTLNPYHVGSNEILAKAVENIDLFPGWITRVYPVPDGNKIDLSASDLGSFVLNETRFSLLSHRRYGIAQPSVSMYRLNGLFPSRTNGRLQVGVEFFLTSNSEALMEEKMSQIASCYARIDINQKRVIDKRLHLVTKYSHEQVIIGEVELNKGLFPISAMIYCDEKSDFNGEEVEVSISFRNSGQYNLSTSRNSIFHIYKPQNSIAKL